MKENDRVDRLAGVKAVTTCGLRLGRSSEALRSLRHCTWAQLKQRTSRHQSPLWREAWKEPEALDDLPALKGREGAVRQANIGTVHFGPSWGNF